MNEMLKNVVENKKIRPTGSQAEGNHDLSSVSRTGVMRIYLWNYFMNIRNSSERIRRRSGVIERVSMSMR